MKTPATYTKMLKEERVTKEILGEVLYSYNKRAKNYRDQKRKYRNYTYDKYNNYEKNEEKENEMYEKKEYILRHLNPICIHREIKIKDKRIRYYSYEEEFDHIKENLIIKDGQFWDNEIKDLVYFVDVIESEKIYLYFLYYEIGGFTFHTPINENEIEKYNLNIIDINDFTTKGRDINDLLSLQFCNKVYNNIDLLEII